MKGLDLGSRVLVPISCLVCGGNYQWEFNRELFSFVWFMGIGMGIVL